MYKFETQMNLEQATTIIVCDSIESVLISNQNTAVISTNVINNVVSEITNEFDVAVEIHVSEKHASLAIDTAIHFNIPIFIDRKELKLKIGKVLKHTRDLAAIKARYATTVSNFKFEFDRAIAGMIRLTPTYTLQHNEVFELAKELALAKPELASVFISNIDEYVQNMIDARYEKVKSFHSISGTNRNITFLETDYKDGLFQSIISNYEAGVKQTFVLNAGTGFGKTTLVINPAFAHFSESGEKTLMVSARQSQAAPYAESQHYYRRQFNNPAAIKSSVGVINTIFGDLFEQHTENPDVLILDEIEETLSHRSIGNGFVTDVAKVRARLEAAIKAAKLVIVSDAGICDSTINWIAELRQQPVVVAGPAFERKQKAIKYHPTKKQMIAAIEKDLAEGKKVFLFTDSSIDTTRALHAAFTSKFGGFTSIMIDSEFTGTSEGKCFIKNISAETQKYDLVIATPAIASSTSIENDHFDAVYVLCASTILPTGIMQAMNRVRKATDLNIAFDRCTQDHQIITNTRTIEHLEYSKMVSSLSYNEKDCSTIMKTCQNKKVIDRISFENSMRKDYRNTVLIMLEQKGYDIVYIDNNDEAKAAGSATLKVGKNIEGSNRVRLLTTATKLTATEANSINKNMYATFENKKRAEATRIMNALGKNELTEEDVANADAGVCNYVDNIVKLRSLNTFNFHKDQMGSLLLKKVFEIMNIDPVTLTGTYTNVQTDLLKDFLMNGYIGIDKQRARASAMLTIAFGTKVNLKARSMQIAKTMLGLVGLSHEDSGRKVSENGVRNKLYQVTHGEYSDQIERYYELRTK